MSPALIEAIILGFGLIICLALYPRVASKNKIICFIHGGRKLRPRMLKEDQENKCVWIGREGDEDRERYIIDENKMFTLDWPSGFPAFLQVPVRALWYVRDKSEPYDPSSHNSKYGAKYLRLITDVNMLKSQWRDVRESLKLAIGAKKYPEWLVYVILIAVLGVALIGVYISFQNASAIQDIKDGLSVTTITTGG